MKIPRSNLYSHELESFIPVTSQSFIDEIETEKREITYLLQWSCIFMTKLYPLIPVKVSFPLFFQNLSLSTFPTPINGLKDSVFKLLILGQLGNGEFLHNASKTKEQHIQNLETKFIFSINCLFCPKLEGNRPWRICICYRIMQFNLFLCFSRASTDGLSVTAQIQSYASYVLNKFMTSLISSTFWASHKDFQISTTS